MDGPPSMLTIVIAAYNEQDRLPRTIRTWTAYLDARLGRPYEFLVVDDGSADGTAAAVKALARESPRVRLLKLPRNQGRGAAIRAGVMAASGEIILETDADGSVDIEAVPRFARYLDAKPGVDALIGSRNLPDSRVLTAQPLSRVFLGHGFHLIARALFGWDIVDYTLGFKMFRRAAARDVFARQFEDGYVAEAEIVFVTRRRGWALRELPVLWTDFRDSRVQPLQDSLRSFYGLARIVARDRMRRYLRDPHAAAGDRAARQLERKRHGAP